MNLSVEQFRTALHDAAQEITDADVPPLSLAAVGQRSKPAAGRVRHRGQPSRDSRQRRRRWLAPVGAAAAVLLVVALPVTFAVVGSQVSSLAASQPVIVPLTPQLAGLSLESVPRYYMALPDSGSAAGAQRAVIKSTITGVTVATIGPPKHYVTFSGLTGAADDRTFVLAAQPLPPQGRRNDPVKLFQVRFNPAANSVITPLPIPRITGTFTLSGLALSPDGSRLAVALQTGPRLAQAQVRIYSMATGAVRIWKSDGQVGQTFTEQGALSWASDGTLAFNWTGPTYSSGGTTCFKSISGLWLLNTAAPSGSLLASSRLSVAQRQPGGLGFSANAFVTPGGAKVIAPLFWFGEPAGVTCMPTKFRPVGDPYSTQEFEEFAAATGNPLSVIYQVPVRPFTKDEAVAWSNPSGSVLVVQGPALPGAQAVFGVVSGDRFIPIPNAPAVQFPTTPFAF